MYMWTVSSLRLPVLLKKARRPIPAVYIYIANLLVGLGERCKLPQQGLGRSPSRNRIWCIFA